MKLVVEKSGAKSVSIIAHSMGNQPTLQVLRDLKRDSDAAGIKISQIILAAPDVDRDNFENIAKEIQGLASGVTLYAASNDRALRVSRNFYGGIPRAGDVPDGGPLVVFGRRYHRRHGSQHGQPGPQPLGIRRKQCAARRYRAVDRNGHAPPECADAVAAAGDVVGGNVLALLQGALKRS